MPELIATAVQLAKGGEVAALNMLLGRCASPLRRTSEPINFDLALEGSLADKARAILAAIAASQIDPQTCKALICAVAAVADVESLDGRH